MTQITLEPEICEKLNNLHEVMEFRDESGHLLGRFLPVIDLSQYEPLEPQVSEEELQRRMQSNEKTYTTAEVLAYLESLECSE